MHAIQSMVQLQLRHFESMLQIQDQLESALLHQSSLESILALLEQKGAVVDEISKVLNDSQSLILEWMEKKSQLILDEGYQEVDDLLAKLQVQIISNKSRDEAMLGRFEQYVQAPTTQSERDKRSQQIIQAYRALR